MMSSKGLRAHKLASLTLQEGLGRDPGSREQKLVVSSHIQ